MENEKLRTRYLTIALIIVLTTIFIGGFLIGYNIN